MSQLRRGDRRRRGVMARVMTSSRNVARPVAKAMVGRGIGAEVIGDGAPDEPGQRRQARNPDERLEQDESRAIHSFIQRVSGAAEFAESSERTRSEPSQAPALAPSSRFRSTSSNPSPCTLTPPDRRSR